MKNQIYNSPTTSSAFSVRLFAFLTAACLSLFNYVNAQPTTSYGTGSEGVYVAPAGSSTLSGTHNYTSFTIGAGNTVTATGGAPLVILCTGVATINGTLTAAASAGGTGGTGTNAAGGTLGMGGGGGWGATGATGSTSNSTAGGTATNGNSFSTSSGGGGGGTGSATGNAISAGGGGGGGYSANGSNGVAGQGSGAGTFGTGGTLYGNSSLSILMSGSYLLGGSGGGGGGAKKASTTTNEAGGGGGGGGGGAIQINAQLQLAVGASGLVSVQGGTGGNGSVVGTNGGSGGGGGGSGGSIYLQSPSIVGVTAGINVNVSGGTGGTGGGAGTKKGGNGGTGAAGYLLQNILQSPACSTPTGVSVGSITNNSASVSFSCASCSGTYILEYGAPGFVPGVDNNAGTGGTIVTGSSSPISISGLSALTTYDVYVRQNCGGGNYGGNSVKVSFTTADQPTVNFTASTTVPCLAGCISFTDQSTQSPTSWSWTFTGGTPGTSTAQNPTNICYSTPGTYDVTLSATNTYGTGTLTKTGYIVVAPTLTGTVSVGPTGTFTSITAALARIALCGFSGNLILELQSNYVSTAETFPISFSSSLGSSYPSHTITLRPASGATSRVITTTNAIAIDLNGVQGIIIDGQPGGTGGFVSTNLSIISTTSSITTDGVGTVRFINDAQNNQVIYCTLSSPMEYNATPASSGIILFSTSAGGSGNSNNTVDHCLLQPTSGTTTLVAGITSMGTATSGHENSTNAITNSSFNFALSTGQSWITFSAEYGIYLGDGNQNWTITSNSFYSSNAQSWPGASSVMIKINPTTSGVNGCVINNNFFGGSAAQCTGSRWSCGNNTDMHFQCIGLNVGTATPTSVQGNTCQNLLIWAYNHYTNHAFIDVINGSVDIGTTSPNIMGSQTSPNSIEFESGNNSANDGQAFNGIMVESTASSGTINIRNNVIGGISFFNRDGTNALEWHHFYGISFSGSGSVAITIDNNIIGNATTHASGVTSNSSLANVIGIYSPSGSSSNTVNITNNTIDSLSLGGARTDQYPLCYGIFVNGSWSCNITGNTVRNLVNRNGFSGVSADPVVAGISNFASSSSSSVSKNQVYNLSTTTSGTVGPIMGIRLAGTLSTVSADGNLVYQLSPSTAAQTVRGIQTEQGSGNVVSNNMVSLGFDKNGNTITLGADLIGIYDVTGNTNYLFNSVQMGGSGVLTTSTNTHAFRSDVTSGSRAIKNNIFYNTRSNASSTGSHYAIRIASNTGLTINNNDYFTDGTGGILGNAAGTDKTSLALWQAATGQDANSISVPPVFTSNTDLHLQTGVNCAFDGTGATGTGVTIDYDNQSRNSPPDIGADEFTSTFSAVANAGSNQTLCASTSTNLGGNNAPGGTSGLWTIVNGSGGSITTPSSPTSLFSGTVGTTYQLKWTISTNIGSCSSSSTVLISFSSPITSVSCGGTNVSCHGSSNGSASVTVTGGTTPFTFLWNNGATSSSINGLSGGTYSVTVSNGCGASNCSYTVIEPAVLNISASSNSPVCIGDNLNLSS